MSFNQFWEAFAFAKGKAEAADAWLDIPELTDSLVGWICDAARQEADGRDRLIAKGQTPKWAQGWLNGRRWEDYEPQRIVSHWEKKSVASAYQPEPEMTAEERQKADAARDVIMRKMRIGKYKNEPYQPQSTCPGEADAKMAEIIGLAMGGKALKEAEKEDAL